jgi:hypothetical protein
MKPKWLMVDEDGLSVQDMAQRATDAVFYYGKQNPILVQEMWSLMLELLTDLMHLADHVGVDRKWLIAQAKFEHGRDVRGEGMHHRDD